MKLRRTPAHKNDTAVPEDVPHEPWTGDMVLQEVGEGEKVEYPRYSSWTVRLQWASRTLGEDGAPLTVRTPSQRKLTLPVAPGFVAAGRPYAGLGMLTAKQGEHWSRDIYGRQVLCLRERFPCFDSYDYANEDRYFRWYFLLEGGKLTRVFHADGSATVVVTEDVRDLERTCWEQMQRLGVFS